MSIFRSILTAIREPLLIPLVIGFLVSGLVIGVIESVNSVVYKPADAPGTEDMTKLKEYFETMQKDPQRMGDWLKSLPMEAHLIVLAGWQVGAFLGGLVSALLAGRARYVHAGTIGGLVLAGTVLNDYNLKQMCGFTHPDWMIIAGLLLPLPVSLLAGKLVSTMLPSAPEVPPSVVSAERS